ncbi:breast cancer anti-estrogen resistance protein 1-like isoform X2 [Rhopilema esculentum]|uniref:breast cancer anti-estrogen resistance protein 1-like isoform X2 n=1 Tax=Rhopilema esculentum TaxID=499914 RepID=UPI0031E32364
MTLLAKALYDNLADAPDELSFRKGDIVTVIERDVDGLVGWWLCLLHGKQGIAPGNRLKLFSSLDDPSNTSGSQGSLSAEEFSESSDFTDGGKHPGSEYDVLPAPVKASHGELFDSPSPKALKDVYSSPSKIASQFSQLNYATPSKPRGNQEDYDVVPTRPKMKTGLQMSPAELYDIPSYAVKTSDEVYDFVPKRRPTIQSTGTIGPKSPVPKFQNALSAFTAIPDEPEFSGTMKLQGHELYDVPKPNAHSELYDVPKQKPDTTSELYDVPKPSSGNGFELYDVPSSLKAAEAVKRSQGSVKSSGGDAQEVSDRKSPQNVVKPTASNEALYDAPPSNTTFKRNFDLSRFRQDLTNVEGQQTGKKQGSALNDKSNASNEIYDVPPASFARHIDSTTQDKTSSELYDTPSLKPSGNSPFASRDIFVNRNVSPQEIYDTPPALRKNESKMDDIYDTPPAHSVLNQAATSPQKWQSDATEIYDVPPNQNSVTNANQALKASFHANDQIYNEPPHHDIYDVPPSDGIYDQLPNAVSKKAADDHTDDSLYDVPTHHDVNKVMSDISKFKTTNQSLMKPISKRHQTGSRTINSDDDDDDYVDYQDIYGKEPPTEIVKEIEKTSETSPRVQPKKPPRKKSSFDQINMAAVRALKLTCMQAYDRLNKLHLAVDTSVTALVSHSNGDWLEPRNLEVVIDPIRDMANKVKLSLRLLTEFGLGAMVNAKAMSLDSEAETIKNDLEPLLECYYKVKVCLMHLDTCKWSVPSVRDNTTDKFFATVNAIMILAGRVPEACRKLTSTLHFGIKTLFFEDSTVQAPSQTLVAVTEKAAALTVTPQLTKQPDQGNMGKTGTMQMSATVNDKKVREILELDARPVSVWKDQESVSMDKANGADMSPMEMKQEFQSRRQKGYNSTLPRRPPVPPKPSLPANRRSMAGFVPDEDFSKRPALPKADTLVTDFITEDGRKKYASDPSRSPVDLEHTRKPEWGGSCPQLDDHSTYASPQSMLRATSSGTAASTTSTASFDNSADDLDANANLSKMASDSNLLSQTMLPSRVTQPITAAHSRSVSLPWDDNKIPFRNYDSNVATFQNVANDKGKRLSTLDHRDTEALSFFLQRVESQFLILRDAVRNLTESVSNSETPQVFVSHSKFVILTAHKVVHAGEELCAKLLNNEVRFKVKRATARLADSIRGVVAGTKQAALAYPDQNSLMEMVTTVLSVGESVREVHKEAKKALEL